MSTTATSNKPAGAGAGAKPAKQAMPGQRANTFKLDPATIYVERRPGHRHYKPSCDYVPTEGEIAWASEHGIGLACKVVYDNQVVTMVEGRKRLNILRAANERRQAAGLPPLKLECSPFHSKDALLLARWANVLNHHRHHDDEITEALSCAELKDLGLSDEEIAADMEWESARTVQNRLRLLALCDECRAAVTARTVTVTRAMQWSAMTHDAQRAALKAFLAVGDASPDKRKKQIRRPTQAKLARCLESLPSRHTNLRTLVRWAAGEVSDEEVGKAFPALAAALAGDA